jgi:hypothetical protein
MDTAIVAAVVAAIVPRRLIPNVITIKVIQVQVNIFLLHIYC